MSRPIMLISALLLALLSLSVPLASAQTASPPDYQIYLPGSRVDGEVIILTFSVYNRGGASTQAASAEVTDRVSGDVLVLGAGIVPPLTTGSVHSVELELDITRYPSGSTQQIEIIVARPEIQAGILPTMTNNTQVLSLLIPAHSGGLGDSAEQGQPPPPPTPAPDVAPTTIPLDVLRAENPDNLIVAVPLTEFYIDFGNERDFLLIVGIGVLAGLIVVLVVMLFRALFSGPPQFGNWQPPYANMPTLDPSSMYGRRQQWQFHAQNNLLPASGRPGVIIARKLLNGMDDQYLSGWRLKALRMTQYDMYGRVSRSQVLMRKNDVKRLDKIAARLDKLTPQKVARRVRPAARRLAKQFIRKITRRSAMLAIALDVRLQGRHGEVRILFELYDYANGHPVRLDAWEPEMTVLGKAIYDSYTYTLFGQHGGESYRDFRKRLVRDIERAMADMLRDVRPVVPEAASAFTPSPEVTPAKMPPVAQPEPTPQKSARATQPIPKVNNEVIFEVEDDDAPVSQTQKNRRADVESPFGDE